MERRGRLDGGRTARGRRAREPLQRRGVRRRRGLELHLPAVSDELEGEEDYAGETFATAHWALGRVHLDLGLSLELERGDDGVELSPEATAGATLVCFDPLFFTLELALELEDDELDATVAPGVIWHPADDVELGIAFPVGLMGEHEVGVLLSLTIELGG